MKSLSPPLFPWVAMHVVGGLDLLGGRPASSEGGLRQLDVVADVRCVPVPDGFMTAVDQLKATKLLAIQVHGDRLGVGQHPNGSGDWSHGAPGGETARPRMNLGLNAAETAEVAA